MTDARCPEPKPFTILLLGLGGAIGGALDGLIADPVIDRVFREGDFKLSGRGSRAALGAVIGGGMGLGIGVSVAISRRVWARLLLGPFLGAMGGSALFLVPLAGSADASRLSGLLIGLPVAWLGAQTGLLMTLAHDRYCRRGHWPKALVWYAILGVLSGCAFWCTFTFDSGGKWYPAHPTDNLLVGILTGLVFGLAQFLSLFAVLAWDRRMRARLEPPPSAPSPGPGP